MSFLHPIYPSSLLDELDKGQHLHRELSDEVLNVLQNDQEVKDLILKKTKLKYDELLKRSK